jgi:hypothetical protein
VCEAGHRARLALEALTAIGMVSERYGQHFNGDGAIETGVGGAIDLAHAACTKRCDDFVRAEACAGREGHLWVVSRLGRNYMAVTVHVAGAFRFSPGQLVFLDGDHQPAVSGGVM